MLISSTFSSNADATGLGITLENHCTSSGPGMDVCVRRPETKGSQLQPLGLVHWQASWPLRTLSGQDVSLSEEESHQSFHLLQEGGPLPGPEPGLLSNTWK